MWAALVPTEGAIVSRWHNTCQGILAGNDSGAADKSKDVLCSLSVKQTRSEQFSRDIKTLSCPALAHALMWYILALYATLFYSLACLLLHVCHSQTEDLSVWSLHILLVSVGFFSLQSPHENIHKNTHWGRLDTQNCPEMWAGEWVVWHSNGDLSWMQLCCNPAYIFRLIILYNTYVGQL